MAEVRLRLGREAYNIAIYKYSRPFLEVRSKRGGSAVCAPSLSTRRWSDLVQNGLSNTAGVHSRTRLSLRNVSAGRAASSQGCCYETESPPFPRSVVGDTELYQDLSPRERDTLLLLQSTWDCCDDDDDTSTVRRRSHFSRGQKTDDDSPQVGASSSCSRSRPQHALYHHLTRRPAELLLSHPHVLLSGQQHHHRQQLVFTRRFGGNGYGDDEPLYKTKTGYYDILEVSPDATHAQIKTAYYKLSFIYHPDKNAGSEDANLRFSDISEAYNVLGNKTLRRKYDRGILSPSDLTGAARPSSKEDTGGSARQPTASRQSVIDIHGKNVFDFDKFIKSHYRDQIKKDKEWKMRREELLRKKTATVADWKLGKMMELGVGAMVAVAVAIIFSIKRN